jgi:hypothetical protein
MRWPTHQDFVKARQHLQAKIDEKRTDLSVEWRTPGDWCRISRLEKEVRELEAENESMLMEYLLELRRACIYEQPTDDAIETEYPLEMRRACIHEQPGEDVIETSLPKMNGEVVFAKFLDETFVRPGGKFDTHRISVASVRELFLEWACEQRIECVACDIEAWAPRQGLQIALKLCLDNGNLVKTPCLLGLQLGTKSLEPFIRLFLEQKFKKSQFGSVLLTWFCDELKKWGEGRAGWKGVQNVVNPENCKKVLASKECGGFVIERGNYVWFGTLTAGEYIRKLVSKK